MSTPQRLYVAGAQSGLRGLGRVERPTREELSIRVSQPPLGMALWGGADDAPTAREGESEERCYSDYHRGIKHFMFRTKIK